MMNQQEMLYDIVREFEQLGGILKGGEFLVPVDKGLLLLDKVEKCNIMLYGVCVWYYVKLPNGDIGIADDWRSDCAVDVESLNVPTESYAIVRQFLQELPEHIELISLDIALPLSWMPPQETK